MPLGALDQPDHAVEEGRAGRGGDADADPVGQHLRAAGDGRTIAAGFADDRSGFAGDRRLVDRSHALDHLAVGGDRIAGFDQDDIADLELGRRDEAIVLLIVCARDQLGLGLGALAAQGVGLRLAAALGDGFGEIGEQHGEPQPENDLELEADMPAAGEEVANEDHRGQHGDDLEHEHHRILDISVRGLSLTKAEPMAGMTIFGSSSADTGMLLRRWTVSIG